ncbi:hypothetical protein HF086_004196 [Spodoptera exigua]|uniref:Glutamate [NMDA] receptor subunit 1 n=1 Tax=Spodoptera exigua TaxID=7107 RepID=A0A922ML32_SPOEX|nr:hypothetical protein HF086_004196 [Spodoptera exigua]
MDNFKIFICNLKLKPCLRSKMWAYHILLAVVWCGGTLVAADIDRRRFSNPTYYNVGGVLSSNESIAFYKDTISVYAVVVSHPLTGDLSPAAVSYTSGFYHIPVIGISSRDSAFSDKNIHVSFLRTVPPYSHQADVWVDVLKHFNYMKSVDEDVDRKVVVEQVIEFEPGLDSFSDRLMDVKGAQARVFLMYASKTDAEIIFRDATFLNMTTVGYVWMVTEQALDAANAPEGLLGLRLVNATNEHAHIQDSIYVLASAIRDMNTSEEIHAPPSDCDNSGSIWTTGRLLFDYIRKQRLENGATGHVAFDDHGDRVHAEYDMVNVRAQGEHVAVGKYFYFKETQKMRLELKEQEIIWMGRSTSKPEGFMIPTHLKVLTIEEKPFVYTRRIDDGSECTPEEIPCPHYNASEDTGLVTGSDTVGILWSIRPSRSSTLVSFLQPFSNTLWILVMVSVHVVALVLYLLDRFSPFGRFKLANIDGTEEDALNLSSAIWFAWGVLLNSGIGEGTPRSFSARVLGMVWAGFAMIIVASYTANLAAFLVLERPKTKLTGINDARLRNTMENLTCATVKGSAVDMYFRRQVELSNMYRTMEANNYDNAEQAIEDVKNGKLMAFIWDSSRLEFEAAQDCELVTAGELFGRSGYGVGLQKGSPWADLVTLAILDFHESGIMESLDNLWILRNNMLNCEENEKTPNTLGLKNMAGVFILVLAGIIGGIVLIVIEVVYKRHQIKKQKRMEIARHAADRWRGAVEKRKTLRAAILPSQRRAKSNGVKEAGSISLAVERGARRRDEPRVPRYLPAYTPDVSHLVV